MMIPPATSASDPASYEETVVRIKDLKDLVLPLPPERRSGAWIRESGPHGHWTFAKDDRRQALFVGQDCLTSPEEQLKADKRFPRTTREIAAKRLKACRKGKLRLLFQNMVGHERNTAGAMPNGRVMLRSIFKRFQLERDRIGVLGERNLLGLKPAGQSVADIEAFREKYNYILRAIPLDELFKERTLFNHLIGEFKKCPIMKRRVGKAHESAHDSHRRACACLWAKADLAIELAQQKRNRGEFDQDVKLHGQGSSYQRRDQEGEEEEQEKLRRKGSKGRIQAAPQLVLRLKVGHITQRDVRDEKECCRSIHHQPGLPYSLRPFACLSMSFDRPSTFDPTKTQWEALTKEKFDGVRCCFGQLVWYRLKSAGKSGSRLVSRLAYRSRDATSKGAKSYGLPKFQVQWTCYCP